ncbi:uncharacterized protein LOC125757154 [Rhipicephalus sanguineus]|uniref:uncharacterized protein LOC125757154 n=1 Tax=Rhipicephalus sanguineus TaxID=34632 RepID=UPI0020C351AD|nr:uncharacterized protein LOC125757154 [Rhipicephalus sanguineus]
MMTGAWNDVKKTTVVNCFRKAGFLASPDDFESDITADDDMGCLENDFRQLSAFPGAIADGATASDFVGADDDVQAVSDLTDAEIVADVAGADEADLSSDDDADDASKKPCAAAELASAFSLIRRCCGAMEGAGLGYLEGLSNIEDGLMKFMADKKKQSNVTDFFHAK